MTKRDEFRKSVVEILARRAGHCCSNPDCRRRTSGPGAAADTAINIGVAAHISAAAPGGPRFDPKLSHVQRAAATNGIWLCQTCSKLIDSDETQFTPTLLLEWRSSAELRAQSYLQTPEPPQGIGEPTLVLPSTDPAVSWLPFSARATTFVGRDTERAQLAAFLESGGNVSWWLLTGAAGAGKSRLALELCRDFRPRWDAGFLSRTDSFTGWSHFRPSRPTLIVVDYISSRAAYISEMVLVLARSAVFLTNPVRVLLLERDRGSWWSRFLREESHSECTELIQCQYDDPLQLGGLAREALNALAEEVAHLQGTSWSDSIARAFEMRMRTVDPLARPLFGMLAAAHPGNDPSATLDPNPLTLVLRKEAGRRRERVPDADRLQRMENLIMLATLVGGLLPKRGNFTFLGTSAVAPLLPDLGVLDPQTYRELIAATNEQSILLGLQPDILGERFILDRLEAKGGFAESAKRLVQAAWAIQPEDFCDFVVRAASDFPDDPGLATLCDLPLPSAEARFRWGCLVGDLVRVANSSTDRITNRLLETLRDLADTHSEEASLLFAVAQAEFYLGNILLFTERDYARAAAQFDVAISAGTGTEIEAAAINARGILHHEIQEEDKAFSDFGDVIAKPEISDEARACALNNRADIFARRAAHAAAIHDRSEVLALKKTSPDRRYIALLRRSHSYHDLGRTGDALRDLESILNTGDISPEQKAEALVERGALLRQLGRPVEARRDLETVLADEELFPGTSANALIELAELSRTERDADRAQAYLDMATASWDIATSTLVDALIIHARLLSDRGEAEGSERIWQRILNHPNATMRHKEIAANRGAPSPRPSQLEPIAVLPK